MMGRHNLHERMERIQLEAETLHKLVHTEPVWQEDMLPETLEELQTTLEELQTTLEELQLANEELSGASQLAEVERRRYQALFDYAPDSYLLTDVFGTIREANRAAAALLGVPPGSLRGKPLSMFVLPDERRAFRGQLAQLQFQDYLQHWEVYLQPRQGVPVQVVISVMRMDDTLERMPVLRWLLRDISPSTDVSASPGKLEGQVDTEQQRLWSLVEALPEGVLLLDADQRLVLANATARRYLGLLTTTTLDERLITLGGQVLERLCQPQANGRPHEVAIGPPLQVFEIQAYPLSVGPVRDGWVLRIHEVTAERDRRQQATQQAHLATTGQLTAGLAHDFNNILNVVLSYTTLVQRHPRLPEEAQQDLEVITKQAQRGAELVRQLFNFSRQFRGQLQPLDFLSVLDETVTMLKRILPESIAVTLQSAPGMYLINGDDGQLQQLLTNLAFNARDAMPDGGALCFHLSRRLLVPGELQSSTHLSPDTWVVLTVEDNGPGMTPEVQQRIFQPFFTTKGEGKGAGVGLTQVASIVRHHHGSITVQSRPEQGTIFKLYLPALPQLEATPGSTAAP